MHGDTDKNDEAVLGLLWLTLHSNYWAWKSMDWDALDRLFERGLIADAKNKSKSVAFTEEGWAAARTAFEKLFAQPPLAGVKPPDASRRQ